MSRRARNRQIRAWRAFCRAANDPKLGSRALGLKAKPEGDFARVPKPIGYQRGFPLPRPPRPG